ncbi:MAG: M16 family metallopeptidase [Lentimonas sp.]
MLPETRNAIARIPLLLVAICCGCISQASADQGWAHERSDIAVDPAVHFGELENGLRYVILPNSEPPGRVSLRLHVASGSLDEAEDQRGLAHFLEHMAFNGSRNFPNVEELIPQMQRLGIAFGAHANAYTSFDETVYMLDLPNTDVETLDLTFTVMRDFADGALLAAEEIEKERGVVIAELKSRDSVQMRLMEQRLEFMMPDHLVSKRLPIGLETVIQNASREPFVRYYEDNYTPDNMVFVAVGDIEVAAFEARIRGAFDSMAPAEAEAPKVEMGTLPSGYDFRAGVFSDEEVSADSLSLSFLRSYTPELDTVANRNKYLPIKVAYAVINRRFQILSKQEGSPISEGSAGQSFWMNMIESHSVGVNPEEGKWRDAVSVLEQELRRALKHGFTQSEIGEIKANRLNAMKESVKRAGTRKSPGLASAIVGSVHDDYVFDHPEESLRIYLEGEHLITPEACHEALQTTWAGADLNLILTTKTETENTKKKLEELYLKSQVIAVSAPKVLETKDFAYTDFGTPGTIVNKTHIEDLDFMQLTLCNNIRVNLKQTDFQENAISLVARFGNGILTQPADSTGLNMVASAYLNGGGLGEHSNDELRRILAGRNASASYSVGDDAFSLSGDTTPDDLELQLQLMCAMLTDPGYRDEALRQFHKQVPAIENQLKHTLAGAAADMTAWVHGSDTRFAKVDPEKLLTYTKKDVQAWFADERSSGYLELNIVGDFDPETAIPIILNTFGALPDRAADQPALVKERKIHMPEFPAERGFSYDSKIDKAVALLSWQIDLEPTDVKKLRRMNVLSSVVRDRLRKKLREELGSTYSPSASFGADFVFNTSTFSTNSVATKAEVGTIQGHMKAILSDLLTNGIDEDEFQRAIEPVKSNLELTLRQNSYWLGTVLSGSTTKPYQLDWARERDADYASITVAEVEALAKRYLLPENAAVIELAPEAPETQASESESSSL